MTPTQNHILREFRSQHIRFLVIGGQAMLALGIKDRVTHDLDLWVARDPDNAKALAAFLKRHPCPPSLDRLSQPNLRLTIGTPPEVDLLNSVAGDPPFDECLRRARKKFINGQSVLVISPADLLQVKEASARQMSEDAGNPNLSAKDRSAAERTAARERSDSELLQALLTNESAA